MKAPVRLAALLVVCASFCLPRESRAVDIPDPAASTVPAYIYLVGQTAGVADPCGEFTVHVAKVGGGAYVGGVVAINFKHTPDLDFAATQPFPGVTVDCATREVYATTDAGGNATFRIVGSCIQHPGSTYVPGPCEVHVTVDGVCLGDTKARAFDIDGQDGVTANDISIWVTDFGCGPPYTCVEDYDNDGDLNVADLSIFVSVLMGHGSQETGDLCLAPPPPPTPPVTGGITLATSNCNLSPNYSLNYCLANRYTDFVGSVTIAGGLALYTGVEAIVKVTDTGGGVLPAYWRFDDLTPSTTSCPGFALGCNRTRLIALPPGLDTNGDPNCISGSTAYGEGSLNDPGLAKAGIYPHPVTTLTSDEQLRFLYSLPGCTQGDIPANTATVVFGFRINHGTNPALCAGCAASASILFTVEELRLTNKITGKAGCSCTAPQRLTAEHATHAGVVDEGSTLVIYPGPGDLNSIFADGHRPSTNAVGPSPEVIGPAWLAAATPNPAGRGTTLRFNVPSEQAVRLAIYDAAGRRLRSLADGTVRAGTHAIEWDGRDESGATIASGIYFIRLTAGGETFTKSVVLRQ